jgi:hypothetical protein
LQRNIEGGMMGVHKKTPSEGAGTPAEG